ncbi:MAG TPA: chromosome partitioning protein [Roseiflexaceae bacterium]|nr:chromosome partitioning protein [Roseiflexaceae bacterium]
MVQGLQEAPAGAFDPELIGGMRRMLTRLSYQGRLPGRLALLAALRGEGVTTAALALGATLASDQGVRVCVVELNWWAPGLETLITAAPPTPKRGWFGHKQPPPPAPAAASGPGLAGVLDGSVSLDEALIPSTLPNLALLPAGDLPAERRPAAARGAELKARIGQLSRRFEHVILDVPAVLGTSDAIALAALGEACAMVVRQGVTPAASVRAALDEIGHTRVLGVILNRVRISTPRWVHSFLPQE